MPARHESDAQYMLLPVDAQLLELRIQELRDRNHTFSALIQEAIDQSSETTHDNAPYDAAREAKTLNDLRLHEFEGIGRRSTIYTPIDDSTVDIGSIVVLARDGETQIIEVAGDWHDRHDEEHTIVSRRTPLASAILGYTLDDTVRLIDGSQWRISALSNPYAAPHEVEEIDVGAEKDINSEKDAWKSNRLLFVCGHHASGKSYLIEQALNDRYVVLDTGPTLRKIHETEAPELEFDEWVKQGEAIHGTNFTDEHLRNKLEELLKSRKQDRQGIVIIGHRTRAGIDYITEHVEHSDSKILYVVALKKIMLERYRTREGKSKTTKEEFDKIIETESRKGLWNLARNCDFKVINQGDIEDAAEKIIAIVDDWQLE